MNARRLWAATIGGVLIADAFLCRRKLETMSQWYGRHYKVLAPATLYLLLHLHGWPRSLRRFDPLSVISDRLSR